MKEYLIEIKDLCFQYPDGTMALNSINLNIEAGKKVCFLGVNGSGKSTLFLHLNGVLKPTSGRILYRGKEVKYNNKALMELRKNVGVVFQDPENQLFSSNVYQEVSFGAMNLGISKEEVISRVHKALKDTNIYELKDKAVHFLSYGQKKRVSISDILVMNPEIIILDEPTSSLDPKHTKDVIEIFNEINHRGITVILSTHDVELAYSWADYIVVMKDGQVAREGTPYEIFSDEQLIKECYLEKPLVLDLFQSLVTKGVITAEKIPTNKNELLELM